MSPLLQPTASTPITYCPPRFEIEPNYDCLTTCAQTEFPGHIARDPLIRRTPINCSVSLYLSIRQNIQKWRLSELYTECLLQRIVEDGIAGIVGEVSKHDRILFREGRGVRLDAAERERQ